RLQRAVSYEEELMATFKKADWVRARPIARQVARRTGGELAAAWALIRERLITLAAGSDRATAIEAALILDRGDGSQSHEALVQIFSSLSTQDLVNSLQALPGADDQRRAVESLSVTRPNDWQEVASLLFMGKKDALRTAALDVLEDLAPEKAVSLLRDLVKAPAAAPETFCFVLEGYLEGSKRPSLELFRHRGARGLLVLVMDLLDHLQHRSQRVGRVAFKEMIGRVESILALGHNRLFIEGAKAMEQDELLDLHTRLVKNDSLTPQIKGAILEALRTIEPSLGRAADVLPSDEDAIYVLPEGLEKKKAEFREIMEVKLQKVIEDIGRARDFGDLSENAEYTAALEERDHLTKRATKMKADLDRVKLITPEMVVTGKAGLGSRIRLKNLRTGEEVVYSVLGPWDGGPQDGVLSYLSPLGLLFQGKKAGDEVDAQLPGGMERFRLLDVASHFEQ
ncbi:MAG TPA: GreA/GreB family elongation factor, partial [Planctomycetota bacterium]|nr:GreA/GreB family elongation factor [Planctomycetota bacterium]